MKHIYATLTLLCVYTSVFSQNRDTCDYVAQNNYVGGLDCATGSLAPYTADSYQWLNCEDGFAVFPNDTAAYYNGTQSSIYVALEVTYLGCVDTSDCYYVCTWGMEELNAKPKKLVRILDPLGRETDHRSNAVLIYIYSDGTREKIFVVE